MKLRIAGLAIAGALVLCGAAFAQNVPEKFVVSGKMAEKIQDFTTINLATAEAVANACEKAATAQGVQITIIVLDSNGNHVYFDRMDGQGYLNIITADMKARAAMATRPTRFRRRVPRRAGPGRSPNPHRAARPAPSGCPASPAR